MEKQSKIRGLLFDLGGVIVESFGVEFLNQTSNKLGVQIDKLDEIIQEEEPALQRGEITAISFWQNVCKKLGVNCPSDDVLRGLWVESYKQYAKVKEDTLGLIKKLKNKYKIGILSNTILDHAKFNKQRGVFDNFDVVMLSNEVGMRKPEKRFFEAAANKLGLSFEELLFVDDEMRWIEAARQHGLRAILFKSSEQLENDLKKEGLEIECL